MAQIRTEVLKRSELLYGEGAQRLLEKSTVCLVNASAVGTEALKSLVLGGVKSFVIVDKNTVTEADLGNNFFVDKSSLGKPRAEVVTRLLLIHAILLEKNESFGKVADPVELLKAEPSFYLNFSVIIISNLSIYDAQLFNDFAIKNDKKIIYVRSVGQLATLQVFTPEHVVVDAKVAEDIHLCQDFRIRNPWKEFASFCESLDAFKIPPLEQTNVPWIVILHNTRLSYLKKTGKKDLTSEDLDGFREYIVQYKKEAWADGIVRLKAAGEVVPKDTPFFENYEQAVNNAHQIFSRPHPENFNVLFKTYEENYSLSSSSPSPSSLGKNEFVSKFWKMIGALRRFVKEHDGVLPVYPSLPDMDASSLFYTGLQQVYRAKAKADADTLFSYAYDSAAAQAAFKTPAEEEQARSEFYNFSTHILSLACIRYRPFRLFLLPPVATASGSGGSSSSSSGEGEERFSFSRFVGTPPAEKTEGEKKDAEVSEEELEAVRGYFLWDADHNLAYLPILHAADVFIQRQHRFPGLLASGAPPASLSERTALYAADVAAVRQIVDEMSKAYGFPLSLAASTLVNDVLRNSLQELHTVSAVLGGVTAQEAFKLVTHHYLPLNNTYVYNGFLCVSASKEL